MVTSGDYRHVPISTLAILAQRLGKVFASATTWYSLVRDRGWRRLRARVHPDKPKVGIRASQPNELWQVDTTIIRLLDGARAYLHAVIDNSSRHIHASDRFEGGNIVEILVRAGRDVTSSTHTPTLIADGGVENWNSGVDAMIDSGVLHRLLAMTDIAFSYSLVESWWRVLKHQWLYLNSLDSLKAVRRLVASLMPEYNGVLPHSASRGQTPDQMDFGSGEPVPERRDTAKRSARQARRLETNRAASYPTCARALLERIRRSGTRT